MSFKGLINNPPLCIYTYLFPFPALPGIRSKISKVFNFVSRDKSTFQVGHVNYSTSHSSPGSRKNSSDIESNTDASSISSASGSHSIGTRHDHKFGRSVARPLEVPKLEVTSPHNQDLIKKYETRYNPPSDDSKPPALPPRRNSRI